MGWGCCWALLWLCAGLAVIPPRIVQGEAVQGHFQPECLIRVLKRAILVSAHHGRSSGLFGLSGVGLVCPPQPRLFMAGRGAVLRAKPWSICSLSSGRSLAPGGEEALQKTPYLFQRLFCASVAKRVFLGCCAEPAWALQSCDKGALSWLAKAGGNPTGGVWGQEGEKESDNNYLAL